MPKIILSVMLICFSFSISASTNDLAIPEKIDGYYGDSCFPHFGDHHEWVSIDTAELTYMITISACFDRGHLKRGVIELKDNAMHLKQTAYANRLASGEPARWIDIIPPKPSGSFQIVGDELIHYDENGEEGQHYFIQSSP